VLDAAGATAAARIQIRASDGRHYAPADVAFFIAWIDRLISFTRDSDTFNTGGERDKALANLASARKEFERRR